MPLNVNVAINTLQTDSEGFKTQQVTFYLAAAECKSQKDLKNKIFSQFSLNDLWN